MFPSKNNTQVLIAKALTNTPSVQITDPTAAAYIADGEIVALDENSVPLINTTNITLRPKIRFVQRSGATATTAKLIYSDWIIKNKAIALKGEAYAAAQEQIYVVGYDGVTATNKIDVTTDLKDFILNIRYTNDIDVWSEQAAIKSYLVPYVTSISQPTVANSLVVQINADPSANVLALHLNSAAGTAIGAAADTVIGSAGSTNLTITDVGANSTVIALVAGDYIRIGTATTDPIYKIAAGSSLAVTGGTVVLETPLATSVNLLGTTAEYITAAQAAAANSGVKLTGKALYWDLGEFKYMKTRFNLGLKRGFGTTTITKTQEAKPGNGVYEQVAEMEWFAKGDRGALNRHVRPINAIYKTADAVSGTTYDTIVLAHYDNFTMNSTINASGNQPKTIVFYGATTSNQFSLNALSVMAVLNAYLADAGSGITPCTIAASILV